LAIGTCLMGITEKLFFLKPPNAYSTLPAQAQLGNVLGLLLIVLAGTVLFVVTNAAFRRVDPEEERVSIFFITPGTCASLSSHISVGSNAEVCNSRFAFEHRGCIPVVDVRTALLRSSFSKSPAVLTKSRQNSGPETD